jgi:hypothetical protein
MRILPTLFVCCQSNANQSKPKERGHVIEATPSIREKSRKLISSLRRTSFSAMVIASLT